jgi:hypothetical protein
LSNLAHSYFIDRIQFKYVSLLLLLGVAMEVKGFRFLLLLVITSSILNVQAKENSSDNQYLIETKHEEDWATDKLLDVFCRPVRFTRSGMRCFLKHTFSRREYAEELLPHNFGHFIEFLEFGKESKQNMLYIQSTIRLFSNKVKSCEYVCIDTVDNLLDRLPGLLESYFVKKPVSLFAEAKNTIKRILYSTFLSKFSFFKQNPDTFFDELSSDILTELGATNFVQTYVDKEQLRQNIIRFLELTLNKVIWTPLDQEEVWTSVKAVASRLEDLVKHEIINQDELDDLFQSLLERFLHFLDLAGADLDPHVITLIEKDIESGNLLFLQLEEQEEYLQPKVERLHKALKKLEAKIIAHQQGILTGAIPS